MSEIFRAHLEKFIKTDDQEFSEIMSFFDIDKVKKKENLLEAGHICKTHYFVLEGCLRKFFINDRGIEQTTEFAIETWWITDNYAFERMLVSDFSIQAVEPSVVLYIDNDRQQELLQRYPKMERYFRFIYQRAFAASQLRFKFLYEFSKQDFYYHLCKTQPEFVQRIPQYLVASFLGFTAEYLSEIRKKMRS